MSNDIIDVYSKELEGFAEIKQEDREKFLFDLGKQTVGKEITDLIKREDLNYSKVYEEANK